jgi:hypothetical protein
MSQEYPDATIEQTYAWLVQHGARPIAVSASGSPASEGWERDSYKPALSDIGDAIGGVLSQKVTDTDVDCAEARHFAPIFLPPTPCIFGRASNPASHWLYALDEPYAKEAFLDPMLPAEEATIIEIRSEGSDGGAHMTVMPGSRHKSGEFVRWYGEPYSSPAPVQTAEYARAVKKVAWATLVVRHLWSDGQRNEVGKCLYGMFYYYKWSLPEAEQFIDAVMGFTRDDDKSRLQTLRSTYKKGEAGRKIVGAGALRRLLEDDRLVDRFLAWFGSSSANVLQEYNERFAACMVAGKFRVARTDVEPGTTVELIRKDDFIDGYGTDYVAGDEGKPRSKAKTWLAHPKRRFYAKAEFFPGLSEEETPEDTLNLWTGWAVAPNADAACDAWLDLLWYVICGGDRQLYDWLLNWLAHLVQHPRNKAHTCPVIIGKPGAGKGMLFSYLRAILGAAYVHVSQEDHIHGKFNAHMGTCKLLHSDEALRPSDKKHRGVIKSLIGDDIRMHEQKGIDAKPMANHLCMAITSNYAEAAPVEDQDRRFTVIDMGDRKIDGELRRRLLAERENGGPAALLHLLLTMGCDDDLARINIKNAAHLEQMIGAMPPLEAWWYDKLQEGTLLPDYLRWASKPNADGADDWPEVFGLKAVHYDMAQALRGKRTAIPNEQQFKAKLAKFCGVKRWKAGSRPQYDKPIIDKDSDQPQELRKMDARQRSIVDMPPLAQCRKAFETFLGRAVEWPSAEDDVPEMVKRPSENDGAPPY